MRLSSTVDSVARPGTATGCESLMLDHGPNFLVQRYVRALHLWSHCEQQIALLVRSADALGVDRRPERSRNGDGVLRQHGVDVSVYFDVRKDFALVGEVYGHAGVRGLGGGVPMDPKDMGQRVG